MLYQQLSFGASLNAIYLVLLFGLLLSCGGGGGGGGGNNVVTPAGLSMDLADASTSSVVRRVLGSVGSGRFGVPVAGGYDMNGDGHLDYAMASMRASRGGLADVGAVFVVFGDGTSAGELDTGLADNRILPIFGEFAQENTGSEIWMDDVTGDGIGDLLIARQNYSFMSRTGAGALSIVSGGSVLATMAAADEELALDSLPAGVTVLTVIGAQVLDRLGMWMRTGDVDGDGISDIVVGADQADTHGENNAGTVYVILGGSHLSVTTQVDLADFGATILQGNIANLNPPSNAANFHFGSSLSVGDLDQNGRAEVYVAAALDRAGGTLPALGASSATAVGSGGNGGGSLFVFWDDNFPVTPWPSAFTLNFDSAPGATSRINGGSVSGSFVSARFGEEVLPPEDYNGDGNVDLFVGDITGDPAGRTNGGVGHVLFTAAELRGEVFSIESPPSGVAVTHILGPASGAIFADTAAHGDFDGDGLFDLAVGSPHDSPLGRSEAGSAQIIWGQSNWPSIVDLQAGRRPDPAVFAITDLIGAKGGTSAQDNGDTLMYSGTAADVDQDGRDDLIINEMQGNGSAASALDVGNLIIVPGRSIPR